MKFHHFYSHWINFWLLLEQSTIGPFMEKILLTPMHMTKALGAEKQKPVFHIVAADVKVVYSSVYVGTL